MKEGKFSTDEVEILKNIYKKIDVTGNLKEPLTTTEQVLLYSLLKRLTE